MKLRSFLYYKFFTPPKGRLYRSSRGKKPNDAASNAGTLGVFGIALTLGERFACYPVMPQTLTERWLGVRANPTAPALAGLLKAIVREKRSLEVAYSVGMTLLNRPSVARNLDMPAYVHEGAQRLERLGERGARLFQRIRYPLIGRWLPGTPFRPHSATACGDVTVAGEYGDGAARLFLLTEAGFVTCDFYNHCRGVRHIHCVHALDDDHCIVTTGDSARRLDIWKLSPGKCELVRSMRGLIGGYTAAAAAAKDVYLGSDFSGRANYILRLRDRKKFFLPSGAFRQFVFAMWAIDDRYLLIGSKALAVAGGGNEGFSVRRAARDVCGEERAAMSDSFRVDAAFDQYIENHPSNPRLWRGALKDSLSRLNHYQPVDVLDVGGGTGALEAIVGDSVQYWLLDKAPDRVAAKPGHRRLCGESEHMPFANESFDLVISISTLQYVDQAKFFRECVRVLRPGGILAIHENGPINPVIRFGRIVRRRSARRSDSVRDYLNTIKGYYQPGAKTSPQLKRTYLKAHFLLSPISFMLELKGFGQLARFAERLTLKLDTLLLRIVPLQMCAWFNVEHFRKVPMERAPNQTG